MKAILLCIPTVTCQRLELLGFAGLRNDGAHEPSLSSAPRGRPCPSTAILQPNRTQARDPAREVHVRHPGQKPCFWPGLGAKAALATGGVQGGEEQLRVSEPRPGEGSLTCPRSMVPADGRVSPAAVTTIASALGTAAVLPGWTLPLAVWEGLSSGSPSPERVSS